MVKIVICDDDVLHLKYTESLIRRELSSQDIEIESFSSVPKLLHFAQENHYQPDIAVLDIDLGPMNGIDLAKRINQAAPACKIIFLTGYPDYAPASYEARHVWFVLKSSADTYLGPALQRALESTPESGSCLGLTAHKSGKSFFLPLGEILYIDRVVRKTRIVCKDAEYLVSGSPSSLVNGSVAPYFVHCHQGYWVNLRQIASLDHDEFILSSGDRIPISRTFREQARSAFFHELKNRS